MRVGPPWCDRRPTTSGHGPPWQCCSASASTCEWLAGVQNGRAPCCKPGAAVQAAGTGAFEMLSKAISVPPGCDLSRCSVTVELLSQGIVYIDEVRLEWSS